MPLSAADAAAPSPSQRPMTDRTGSAAEMAHNIPDSVAKTLLLAARISGEQQCAPRYSSVPATTATATPTAHFEFPFMPNFVTLHGGDDRRMGTVFHCRSRLRVREQFMSFEEDNGA
jgi:hypothetical protein